MTYRSFARAAGLGVITPQQKLPKELRDGDNNGALGYLNC